MLASKALLGSPQPLPSVLFLLCGPIQGPTLHPVGIFHSFFQFMTCPSSVFLDISELTKPLKLHKECKHWSLVTACSSSEVPNGRIAQAEFAIWLLKDIKKGAHAGSTA